MHPTPCLVAMLQVDDGDSVALRPGRDVECGVPIEEPERDPGAACVLGRHDRVVLWSGCVGEPERVPHHQVGVGDRSIRCGPLREASAIGRALRHMIAGRKSFVSAGRSHPQILRGESRPATDRCGCRIQGGRVGRQELVAGGLPE